MASFKSADTYTQTVLDETPEKLERALFELSEAIVDAGDDKADWSPPADAEVGLGSREAFLRWGKYDVGRARCRRAAYWTRRNELFKKAKVNDWPEIDKKLRIVLHHGLIEVPLGIRDLEGRQVIVTRMARLDYTHIDPIDICKCFWFMAHIVYEKESEENGSDTTCPAQFKGVTLFHDLSNVARTNFKPQTIQLISGTIQEIVPIRVAGIRILNQPWFFSAVWTIASIFVSAKLKSRMTLLGTQKSKLLEYCSIENIPVDCGGTMEWDHKAWLMSRGIEEVVFQDETAAES